MKNVLALDIATVSGWARGRVGEIPRTGSKRLGKREDSAAKVFGTALAWFTEMFTAEPRPDLVILEAMLPPEAARGHTTAGTYARLAGLHALALGLAHQHRIPEIAEATVADVRHHFIGERSFRRDRAKAAVMDRCQRLGWEVTSLDAADAAALWSYAASLIDPQQAMKLVPLFDKNLLRA